MYIPNSPYDFAIEDGYGYLIAVNNDTNFCIIGSPIENVSIPLYIGWNMLGWFKEQTTTTKSIYENITACDIVLLWNSSKQNFDLYVNGSPYNFVIKQGDGFLVAVSETSIWHGEG